MTWFSRSRACTASLILGALLSTGSAYAQPPGPADEGVARALFDDAKKLMGAGDAARACPKLEEAVRLQPEWIGTLLWLGDCYERTGRLASASAAFDRVVSFASKKGDRVDDVKNAQARIDALRPRVPRLTLRVPDPVAALPGLVIERDGVAAGRAQWGLPLPIDAGKHRVKVSAIGKQPREVEVEVSGLEQTVEVPMPEDVRIVAPPVQPPPAPSVVKPPPAPPVVSSAPKPPPGVPVWAWGVGAAGLALSGASVGFLLDERSVQRDIDTHCTTTVCDTKDGFHVKEANTHLWRSYGLFVGLGSAGLLALGGAVYGIVSTPRRAPAPQGARGPLLRPEAWVSPGGGGVGAEGHF